MYNEVDIEQYIDKVSAPFRDFYVKQKEWFEVAKHGGGPDSHHNHRGAGGMKLHTLEVIRKALELNQVCDETELIECCLVHDMKHPESLPLTGAQRLAIGATKGRVSFKEWRTSGHHKFVVLVLIADMWSAYINEKGL